MNVTPIYAGPVYAGPVYTGPVYAKAPFLTDELIIAEPSIKTQLLTTKPLLTFIGAINGTTISKKWGMGVTCSGDKETTCIKITALWRHATGDYIMTVKETTKAGKTYFINFDRIPRRVFIDIALYNLPIFDVVSRFNIKLLRYHFDKLLILGQNGKKGKLFQGGGIRTSAKMPKRRRIRRTSRKNNRE